MTRFRFPARLRGWTAATAAVVLSTLAGCGGSGSAPAPAAPASPPPPVTLAPEGISAYTGDESNPGLVDATGRDARFNHIFSLTLDAAGNTYVIDQRPGSGKRTPVIRRITPEGAVTTLPKGSCYTDPRDLTVGGDGHLYVVDVEQRRICRQTLAGEITPVADQASQTDTDLVFSTIARGPGNDLFVANRKAVYRLTPGGMPAFVAGMDSFSQQGRTVSAAADGTGAAAKFSGIVAIAADAAGNVYAGDAYYGIRKVTPQGVVTTVALMPLLPAPVFDSGFGGLFDVRPGMAVQADGSVIVPRAATNATGLVLLRVAPDGQVGTVPGSEKLMQAVPGLAIDATGTIVYSGANGVGRLLRDGTHVQLAGRGQAMGEPAEDVPVAADAAGNLYVSSSLDADGGLLLRKRNPKGELVPYGPGRDTIALPRPPGGSFVYESIAIARDGTAYASYLRSEVVASKVEYAQAEFYKVAPNGDRTLMLSARTGDANFGAPVAIAPAPDGALYFIDAQRLAVRKLNTDGSIVSVTPDRELPNHVEAGSGYHMSASPAGKIYLASVLPDARLFTVNGAGRLELVAGHARDVPLVADGSGAAASFVFPSAPVFDEQGNLYLLDNNTLRRVTPAGVVTTLAGVPASPETRLGALPGSLKSAYGLVRSPDGVFYVRSGDAIVRIRMPAP